MKYRGHEIKPKQDFGCYRDGTRIKVGFVVVADGCNAMPAACWFKTVKEAKHGIDVLLRVKGDADKFWEIMQPFEFKRIGQKADFEDGEVRQGRFRAVISNFKVTKLFSNCSQ